ncbi:MAG: four helix bundle protein [Nitrospirota bacterium]|nr:four helix bundle protein [Nitrospirota bacterium]MDP2381868.1 four helix bundle protein [Nitrospirota bacterium]MDP3596816.1 four helix bundle protein [Nitrospirota bacterium]
MTKLANEGYETVGKKGFKDLLVWQMAKDLAVRVYRVSESQGLKKDFGLCDQIRRSAVSVASNLAEGDERSSDRDSVRFFYMAKGSVAEVRTQIQIACETGHLRKPDYDSLDAEYEQLAKKIGSLIRARSQAPSHSPTPSP